MHTIDIALAALFVTAGAAAIGTLIWAFGALGDYLSKLDEELRNLDEEKADE